MRMTQEITTAASFLLLSACTKLSPLQHDVSRDTGHEVPTAFSPTDGGATASARAQAQLHDVRFDGRTLSGRLLVTAVEGSILLDTRLIESVVLTTETVMECETGRKLSFTEMDVLARPPQDEDLLVLKPGYWFGKDVRIPLFTEGLNGPDVTCIEAELTFHPREGRSASLRVRGMLTAPGDAGVGIPVLEPDTGVGVTGP